MNLINDEKKILIFSDSHILCFPIQIYCNFFANAFALQYKKRANYFCLSIIVIYIKILYYRITFSSNVKFIGTMRRDCTLIHIVASTNRLILIRLLQTDTALVFFLNRQLFNALSDVFVYIFFVSFICDLCVVVAVALAILIA